MKNNNYITCPADLVTTDDVTRQGFINQVNMKAKIAQQYIVQAINFKNSLLSHTLDDLKFNTDFDDYLVSAAGISSKAAKKLTNEDKRLAINDVLENYISKDNYVDELIFRYLLTQGDALGGKIRNITGDSAKIQLTANIIDILNKNNISFYYLSKESKKWTQANKCDMNLEFISKGLSWSLNSNNRTLIFDLNVPIVNKNVDICLFNCNYIDYKKNKAHTIPSSYIALGELKGGIDPAGADEHWKTANTALSRIRSSFKTENLTPHTIFVGAAIEKAMSEEIWNELENEILSNAANLNNPNQMNQLCSWLINL